MPYYGLFSCDLHILDLQWRSPLWSLLFVDITPVCTTLCSMTYYDITMGHGGMLGMPHYGTTMDNGIARDIHCDATMDIDVCYVYITWHHNG